MPDNNWNISVDSREYNLRDSNEVRQLQQYLNLPVDGVYGKGTEAALYQKGAKAFNDRPIDPTSRYRDRVTVRGY